MQQPSLKNFFYAIFLFTFFSLPVFAGGGLDAGTTALTSIKTWLFTICGIMGTGYLIWCIIMAFAHKKDWSDVGMALVYCAIAGGAVVGGTWALSLFQ